MTVRELREFLESFTDDTLVCFETGARLKVTYHCAREEEPAWLEMELDA